MTKKTPAKKTPAKQAAETTAPEPMDPGVVETKTPEVRPNNGRNAYSVDTLIAEVTDLFPEVTYETSNPDWRNANTDVTFDDVTDEGLVSLLRALAETDPRVAEVITEETRVLVSVKQNPRTQDSREPFGLADAWMVLVEDGSL